ncbi:MAG: response regulator transcription factor [Cytophagaceae bacterium]|jgi:DNA-binding response OmpR family regulator|nr:response regulator transcription factor [Cytophagaceae bacterium]
MQVLLIEDEKKLASLIVRALEDQGWKVDVAEDGFIGKSLALVNKYDVLVVDVILPKVNGIQICQELRSKQIKTPILILSALGSLDDKLLGFDHGADDYLVKPFEIKELLARLKALHKRSEVKKSGEKLQVENLVMDLEKKMVTRDGQIIILTAKEFNLLEYFVRNHGRVISRKEISEEVWGTSIDSGTNVIDVYMNFLRKKIDKNFHPKLFHTVVGMGYILQENYENQK